MNKPKKKFGDTVVGGSLIGIASLLNPTLGNVLKGATSIGQAIESIGQSDSSPDEKIMLQEFALKQYEAEVQDRATARNREAIVSASGGSDILFKTIGWSICLAFLGMISAAIGVFDVPESNQRMFDMAFGAVSTAMMAVVSYFFGSSSGSKAKTMLMDKSSQ